MLQLDKLPSKPDLSRKLHHLAEFNMLFNKSK